MATFNWLHFSDLHFGMQQTGWLWPRVKNEVFADLRKLTPLVGSWDVVFFTGDFVQTGAANEFKQLSHDLEQLWQVLGNSSTVPKLCLVPGNHDLVRPSESDLETKSLTQLWWQDKGMRMEFWNDPKCKLRKAVKRYFANYESWKAELKLPMLPEHKGILPGDFSSVIEKEGDSLGIIGLNSTFLQIGKGEAKEKLDMHISQLTAVCSEPVHEWGLKHTANILLTHQPPSWLHPEAKEHFRDEIYPPGMFQFHFCGHEHEPTALDSREGGATSRHYRQAPSLFGFETRDARTAEKRIHGYYAGQFLLRGANSIEKLWPRIAYRAKAGGLNIAPDHRYKLTEDGYFTTPIETSQRDAEQTDEGNSPPPQLDPIDDERYAAILPQLDLREIAASDNGAQTKLAGCPRFRFKPSSHHKAIRQEEQAQVEHELLRNHIVWVVSDWGTGTEGFLGASLARLTTPNEEQQIFHLHCDEASDVETLLARFEQQFGMPLQSFCGFAVTIKSATLLLDGVHPILCEGSENLRVIEIVRAITDYCPNLRIVVVSRVSPSSTPGAIVKLFPLDVPDVRTYLLNHPDGTAEFGKSEIVEKLHDRSGGLPMHLDRILKALKVSSIESILEAELERSGSVNLPQGTAPPALVHAVEGLREMGDKRKQRSYRLLKVLSVLPYGETLEEIKHFLPAEPFFPENAVELNELALLEIEIPPQMTSEIKHRGYDLGDTSSPKILKVPRQVRDYVLQLLSNEEWEEIVRAATEKYFGRRWRDGKVKMRTPLNEGQRYLSSGSGNEYAVIHHLLASARDKGMLIPRDQAAELGIAYCRHLVFHSRYRDLANVAAGIIQFVDPMESPKKWVALATLLGESLRMTGRHEEAIDYLSRSLELGKNVHSSADKASVLIKLALAEGRRDNVAASVAAAKQAQDISKPSTASYIHAEAILTKLLMRGDERLRKLTRLEGKARRSKFVATANNVAMYISEISRERKQKVKNLDKVLHSGERGYNEARAIVAKTELLLKEGNVSELTGYNIGDLAFAYSYLHSQRFGSLFNRCHEALWRIFEINEETLGLFRLFRHSSFVWRIRGDEAKENQYIARLGPVEDHSPSVETRSAWIPRAYFVKRSKALRHGTNGSAATPGE